MLSIDHICRFLKLDVKESIGRVVNDLKRRDLGTELFDVEFLTFLANYLVMNSNRKYLSCQKGPGGVQFKHQQLSASILHNLGSEGCKYCMQCLTLQQKGESILKMSKNLDVDDSIAAFGLKCNDIFSQIIEEFHKSLKSKVKDDHRLEHEDLIRLQKLIRLSIHHLTSTYITTNSTDLIDSGCDSIDYWCERLISKDYLKTLYANPREAFVNKSEIASEMHKACLLILGLYLRSNYKRRNNVKDGERCADGEFSIFNSIWSELNSKIDELCKEVDRKLNEIKSSRQFIDSEQLRLTFEKEFCERIVEILCRSHRESSTLEDRANRTYNSISDNLSKVASISTIPDDDLERLAALATYQIQACGRSQKLAAILNKYAEWQNSANEIEKLINEMPQDIVYSEARRNNADDEARNLEINLPENFEIIDEKALDDRRAYLRFGAFCLGTLAACSIDESNPTICFHRQRFNRFVSSKNSESSSRLIAYRPIKTSPNYPQRFYYLSNRIYLEQFIESPDLTLSQAFKTLCTNPLLLNLLPIEHCQSIAKDIFRFSSGQSICELVKNNAHSGDSLEASIQTDLHTNFPVHLKRSEEDPRQNTKGPPVKGTNYPSRFWDGEANGADQTATIGTNLWHRYREIQMLADLTSKRTISQQVNGHWKRCQSIQASLDRRKAQIIQTKSDKSAQHRSILHYRTGLRTKRN
ncbi:MAG: hypothetical protein MHMPM18_000082 [Marteilia pararefringens]